MLQLNDAGACAVFSFRGRTGRLDFFLGCLALAGVCLVPALVSLAFIGPIRAGNTVALVMLIVLLAMFLAVIVWTSLALQARRLRDMGWSPLYVLPAWTLFQTVQPFVAQAFSTGSIGAAHHATTLVGALVNLGMFGALSLWPSAEDNVFPPRSEREGFSAPKMPVDALVGGAKPSVGSARPSFGRRGLAG